MTTAFQSDAFQNNAFQVENACVFQANAFQNDAFRNCGNIPVIPVQPPVIQAPTTAPDRGFDQYMEAFARSRAIERQAREEAEIMLLATYEDEFISSIIQRLLKDGAS